MSKLLIYRQKRLDGGVRTGVELNGEILAEELVAGSAERNPTLLWFVDVRGDGAGIPDDPDVLWEWLGRSSSIIKNGLESYAAGLAEGIDSDIHVVTKSDLASLPDDVYIAVACSALRRSDGRAMGRIVREFADEWDHILAHLEEHQGVEETS
jgi:hypothetical protein